LAPAQTTSTGQRESCIRSAETSNGALRCTPPIPPVAKTLIPSFSATNMVAATVVPPVRRFSKAYPKSRRLTLCGFTAPASCSSSSLLSPTLTEPSIRAMVAGVAPWARTVASISCASRRFTGCGKPWVITVDSKATIGKPKCMACWTSCWILNRIFSIVFSIR